MILNACRYFLITLWILLISRSSVLINAEIIDYPSSVNAPNSWRNTFSDYSFWESAGVKPILVNGMFVCGFHCSFVGSSCLFAVSIFNTSSAGNNSSFSTQVVWSANRNHPVHYQALLQLTPEAGSLILKDGDGVVVWSPNTVGKSVSSLNLSAEGNLMLFDKTNNMVWQSFDHPTDTLVLGQRLFSWQKLRASVSPSNFSEGLYAFAIINGIFTAYLAANPTQIYYTEYPEEKPSYAEFQTGMFGTFSVAYSANFIRLGSDGHLRAYEWKESIWEESDDLFEMNRCSYPLVCGKYGVCLGDGTCNCPDVVTQGQTTYFRLINYSRPDLGCSAISPISCELHLHHSLLEIQGIDYGLYISNEYTESREDCKEACLKNCSCKAAIYKYYADGGSCCLLSEVVSINMNFTDFDFQNTSAFIKVQNFSSLQSVQGPNNNHSSPKFPEKKRQDTKVIVGSTLGVIFGVFLICTFCFLLTKKRFKEVEEDYLDDISGMPTRFSFEELKNVTKNFSNKLGEGGFGSVFHGTLLKDMKQRRIGEN